MKQRRRGARRRWIVFAAAVAATSISVGQPNAYGTHTSTVTAVTGRAVGYSANVSHFGGPATARGPAGTAGCDAKSSTACSPSVTLPATGGHQPATDTDGAAAQYGPAVLFQSTSMEVGSEGTTGDGGTVTSSARANAVGPGPFSAEVASSTCTASAAGVSGSAAIANGRLVTKTDATTGDPVATQAIAPAPAANTAYTGTLDHVGDSFKAVVNEQISNPDGSVTVNALHLYLLGPTAVGDLVVGQSVCGVTSTAVPDAKRSAATAAVPSAKAAPEGVASSARLAGSAPAVTPAAAPAALPAAPPSGGTGAFGFFAEVGLFGGPANPVGPGTNVVLPSGGSATPVTQTAATGAVVYGPATLFSSGPITATTVTEAGQPKSTVSIQNLNTSDSEVLSGGGLSSTCTGGTGSATATGARIILQDPNPDISGEAGEQIQNIPANPPPNTSYRGTVANVNDNFEAVFNEQVVSGGGITVTAYHLKLLGPTAVGDMYIGQSRCGAAATGTGGGTGTGTGGTGAGAGTTGAGGAGTTAAGGTGGTQQARPGMATTGFGGLGLLLLAITLLVLGAAAWLGGVRLRVAASTQRPADAGS